MKKSIFTLAFLAMIAVFAQAQIVITEIMYNPPEANTDSLEYIELYNNSASTVDLSGWNFTQGFVFTFPAGSSIAAGQYITISKTTFTFNSIFGANPTYVWDLGGALTNGGEDITLVTAAGVTIDSVNYTNMAPWPTGAAGLGSSIVLCDPNSDNNLASSWIAATTPTGKIVNNIEVLANPGAPAGCPSTVTASDDMISAISGNAVTTNVLANDFIPGTLGTLTITTPPANGTAVVNANNTITYTSNAGYCGQDGYTYRVCDSNNSCASADVVITVQCYAPLTISKVATENANGVADSIGKFVEIQGQVNIGNLRGTTGLQFSMEQDGAGITVFRQLGNFGYTPVIGENIRVRGVIQQFNGLTQIIPDTIILLSGAAPMSPQNVNLVTETIESEFVRINGALQLVDPTKWLTGMGTGFTVQAIKVQSPTDTIVIRIDNDVNLFNAPAPTNPFTLQGVGTQFDNTDPYTEGFQIIPRMATDLVEIVSLNPEPLDVQITIAPNPVAEMLNIRMDLAPDAVIITDMQGRAVHKAQNPGQTLDIPVSQWPAGLYQVTVEQGGKLRTTSVVKQ